MKKLLSLFLAFTMLLSVVPVQALAEAEETTELLAQVDEILTLTQDTLTETVSEWEESSAPAETTSDNSEDAFVEVATDNEPTDSPDTQDSAATPAESTTNSEMLVETPIPEEEPNADPGHGYLIFQSSCTWEQAQEYCENLGAHLAVITDEYEQEYIASLVAEAGVSCWIGSRRKEASFSYYWVTDESFSYANWDDNEPSFYSAEDETAEVEHFVGLINSPDQLFPWRDLKESTDEIGGFVCEWDEDYPYENNILAAGYCDNDVTWVLYESGELVVSGNGTLPYYEDESNAPWGRYADHITSKTIPTHIQTEKKTETSEITEESLVLAETIAAAENISADETTEKHSYRIYRIGATWDEAKAYCESLGGHLATITSSEEQQLITDMVTRFGYCCWLGASRTADSDEYNWVTGENFTYTCWADGEPSCLAPDTDEMYLGTYTNVKWNDFSSSTSTVKGFICEWDEADVVSDDVIAAGECGDTLTWTLKTDGTLEIKGSGDMTSWNDKDNVPWYILASEISAVSLPEGLTYIGQNAFRDCISLTKVALPETITSIGNSAFNGCSQLQTIVIPDSVTTIGEWAFSNCSALSSVIHSKNLVTLKGGAFYNCDALTQIHIPASVTSVSTAKHSGTDYGPFGNCDGLKSFTLDDDATSIPANLFYGCTGLETLSIPEGITSIGGSAFRRCTSLTSISLPETLATLGTYAFDECSALLAIAIPTSLETIGNYAFQYCTALNSITISNGTTTIGAYAFCECSALQSIVIPDSVTSIGNCAFSNCTALSDVTLSKNLATLGGRAFYNCDALAEIHIPASVTSVSTAKHSGTDYGPFGNCDGLKSFTLDDDATSIPANLFYGCTGLETLSIPEGITSIGNAAFYNCTGLVGTLEIPDSVITIGNGSFSNVAGVSAISLGSGTTTIATASGTSHAFYGMTGITEVVLTGLTPPEASNADYDIFRYFTALETVYVPAAAYEAYEEAYGDTLAESATLSTDTMQVRILGLKVLGTYSHTVVLSWDAHIDENVTGYIILRDGIEISTTESCTYADRTAEPGQTYTYTVMGCAADGTTTSGTDISATTASPAILSIYTENEYMTLSPLDHTLYASTANTGNMIDFEGSSPVGKFYYITGENHVLIGEAVIKSDLSTNDTAVFSTQWDVSGFETSAYEVVFTITDIDGESASATQTIQIDNDYPERIVSVAATGALTSIYISWTIAAEIDTTGYRIYRSTSADGPFALIASVTDREALTYADKTAVDDCVYYYYVTGVNYLGLESAPSDTVCATLSPDATAPTITKLTPADGRRISGNTSISMTAQDDLSVTACELSYSTDGGQTWTVFATGTGNSLQHTLDTTAFADGELQIKAIARDAAGNESDALIRTYTIDNTGPEKVTGLAYTSTATSVTLSWENVSDEDILYYRVENKNGNDYAQVGSTSKNLGMNITKLIPDTEYIYRVIGYDTNGNRGIESDNITVRTLPDEIAPVVSTLLPAAGYYNDHIDFSVTATDNYCTESITIQASTDKMTWTDLYTENYTDISAKKTFSYTIYLDSYEEGPLYLRAIVSDSSGNISDSSESAPFIQYIVDRIAPAMPENVSAEGQEGRVEIRWTQGPESDLGTYRIYRSDSQNGEFALLADNIRSINYYDRTVEDNIVYYYRVGVCDQAGNESELSEVVSAQSSPDETAPVIHSVYPDSGSTIGQNNNVISALVSDNRTLKTVTVSYRTDENEEYEDLSSAGGIDDYSYTLRATLPLSILEDGSIIHVRVTATDASGNTCKSWEGTYYIDKTAPAVAEVAAAYLEEGTICISWTGGSEADLSHYSVYRRLATAEEYSYIGRVDPGENTNHSLTDNTIAAVSASYVYKIEAMDLCGNTASVETAPVHTEDRSAPTAVLNCESTMQVGVEYLFDASLSTDDSEIVSYHIDLGNGIISTDSSVVGTYAETGIYTATLTVTDDSGNETTIQREITVVERSLVGTIRIQVVDEDGNPVSGAPVYFDLDKGADERVIRNTDGNGYATFTASVGTHYVGCIIPNNEWQPVTKNVVVTAGEDTIVTMTMVHQTLVDGQFEITRMTFDEIIAAGIDVTDPENQYYVHIDITLTYGPVTITGDMIYNPTTDEVHSVSGGMTDKGHTTFPNGDGGIGTLTPKPIVLENGEISLLILEIPVDITSLKEFFDVRLHIINNASSQFSMYDNTVILDLPSGLSIVETDTTAGSKTVEIAEIPGQTTQTIHWILRGDEVGTYTLGADYAGTLSVFETPISARFEAGDPIEVYGMSNLTLKVEIPDTIDEKSIFYYNLDLTNYGEVDVYMPNVDTGDKPYGIDYLDIYGEDIYDDAVFTYEETNRYEISNDLTDTTRVLPVGASVTRHYARGIGDEDFEGMKLQLLDYVYEMQNSYGLRVQIVVQPLSYFKSYIPDHPVDIPMSGTCGTDLYWQVTSEGVLRIYGEGTVMDDYSDTDMPGWTLASSYIKSLSIEAPLTNIGSYAFAYLILEETAVLNSETNEYAINEGSCITLPDTVETIGECAFIDTSSSILKIGAGLANIGDRALSFSELNAIEVSADNEVFTEVDEVLFSKDKTYLVRFPVSKHDTSEDGTITALDYEIPDSTTTISAFAFEDCMYISKVSLPANITKLGIGAFKGAYITEFSVDSSNSKYCSVDGVLFLRSVESIDLVAYPTAKELSEYTVPDTVTVIGEYAFYEADNLVSVTIQKRMSAIKDYAFAYCSSLSNVTIESDGVLLYPYSFAYASLNELRFTGERPDLKMIENTNYNQALENVCTYVYFPSDDFSWSDSYIADFEIITGGELIIAEENLEYVREHLSFIYGEKTSNGAPYELMTTTGRWDKTIYENFSIGNHIAEGIWDGFQFVDNVLSPTQWEKLFENQYTIVLTSLIQNQQEFIELQCEKTMELEVLQMLYDTFTIVKKGSETDLWTDVSTKTLVDELVELHKGTSQSEYSYDLFKISKTIDMHFNDTAYDDVKHYDDLDTYLQSINNIGPVLDCLGRTINSFETLIDAYNYVAAVNAYLDTSASFKATLYESVNAIEDDNARATCLMALDDFMMYYDENNSIEKLCQEITKISTTVLELEIAVFFSQMVTDCLTEWLTNTVGAGVAATLLGFTAGFQLGVSVSNLLLDMDDRNACKEELRCLYHLISGVSVVLETAEENFTNNPTYANAQAFDAAYSFMRLCQSYTLAVYHELVKADAFADVKTDIILWKSYDQEELKNKLAILEVIKREQTRWETSLCHSGSYSLSNDIDVVKVCCPTDVFVYDLSGNLVLSIEDESLTYREFGVVGDAYNGVKVIAVQDIENYTIQVKARETGTMSVVCTNYGEDDEILSTTNFTDVEISYGDSFTATSDGGSSAATLVKNDYEVIEHSSHETEESEIVYVSSIDLSNEVLLLDPSEIYTLTAALENPNATCPTLFWRSSDSDVVTVDECGNLTAISEGTATVICEAIDGSAYASCTIYVGDYIPGDINADTKVDILDVIRLTRHLAGYEVDYSQSAADVNSDGTINTVDLVHLMKYIVGDPDTKL